jgi:ABC-type multidrug transport system ATPase subunit
VSGANTASSAIRVGADPSNRIVIEAPSVSPFHAEFMIEKDKCLARDLGASNGTFLVNRDEPTRSKRINSNGWTELSFNDTVLLGSYRFPLSRLLDIKDIPIEKGKQVYVGRTPDNDRVLNHSSVSSHHARFRFRDKGDVLVEDLASVGGTFVKSKRLAPYTPRVLEVGARVKISSYDLYIDPVSKNRIRVDFSGDLKLDVQNLSCEIADKRILHDISFSVQPGELVGILGPSGHGKSVLLECLIRKPSLRVSGNVRINGRELREYWDSFREQTGYVPQGEVLPLQLSVEQVLRYAARLWIRSDLQESEVDSLIGTVLEQLNISHACRQPLRELSGGELRRVNIAYELIRSPSLLLLDEPTTGLSTKDARIVMSALRELAKSGHTIISVIHQPSRDIYSLFNLVAVLFKGRILYYGPPQFSYAYFGVAGSHPEDVFEALERYENELAGRLEMREGLLGRWVKQFQESPEYDKYVMSRINNPTMGSVV